MPVLENFDKNLFKLSFRARRAGQENGCPRKLPLPIIVTIRGSEAFG